MSNRQVVALLVGLPGSGKSTVAKARIAEHPGVWTRINRDSLREMSMEPHSRHIEKLVVKMRDALIVMAIADGSNVLVDDTNLDLPKKKTHIKSLLEKAGFPENEKWEFEVIDLTDVPVETCIKRDIERGTKAYSGRMVGAKVIRDMYRRILQPLQPKPVWDPQKKTAIICDIDGTLAEIVDRSPYDKNRYHTDAPRTSIIDILRTYYDKTGIAILIVSGRDDDRQEQTEAWLKEHSVPYDEIYMRPTGDNRNDAIIKSEILDKHILPYHNILFVLDDRDRVVQMWRERGLSCLQVQAGDF